MIATLQFDTADADDSADFKHAVCAREMAVCLCDISQILRSWRIHKPLEGISATDAVLQLEAEILETIQDACPGVLE